MSDAKVAHAFVKSGSSTKTWEHMISDGGRLKDGKGGVWWMACTLVKKKCVEIEDHMIIVGEVLDAAAYQEGETGLVYAQGKYRTVGDVVSVD